MELVKYNLIIGLVISLTSATPTKLASDASEGPEKLVTGKETAELGIAFAVADVSQPTDFSADNYSTEEDDIREKRGGNTLYSKKKVKKQPYPPKTPTINKYGASSGFPESCFVPATEVVPPQPTPESNRDVYRVLAQSMNFVLSRRNCIDDVITRMLANPEIKASQEAQCSYAKEVLESALFSITEYTKRRVRLPLPDMTCPITCPDIFGSFSQSLVLAFKNQLHDHCKTCGKEYAKSYGTQLTSREKQILSQFVTDSVVNVNVGVIGQLIYHYFSDVPLTDDYITNVLDRFGCCLIGAIKNVCQLYFGTSEGEDCLKTTTSHQQDPYFNSLRKSVVSLLLVGNTMRCKYGIQGCSVKCAKDSDCAGVCKYGGSEENCIARCADVCPANSAVNQLVDCSLTGKNICLKRCVRDVKACDQAKEKDDVGILARLGDIPIPPELQEV